ncbi:MAG: DUF4392 domain-containing protein [Luminiphilus sp.]|nr:DUF4392 domain-containing protein [Luminiphilus sp.]
MKASPAISAVVEALLVARNPRGMGRVRNHLEPGYCLRAAQTLVGASGNVIICTGFPVAGTFETDGPPGAFALYHFVESLGARPWILAGDTITQALGDAIRTWTLQSFDYEGARAESEGLLLDLAPSLIIVIERPGAAEDGRFYNIAGKDITAHCRPVEPLLELATCPVIAIGDGGNEAGMGRAGPVLDSLNIKPARIGCDELIVADVSNWGAYALIGMAEALINRPVLEWLNSAALLARCVELGAVDGVTHQPTHTEDGFESAVGEALIEEIIEAITNGSEP